MSPARPSLLTETLVVVDAVYDAVLGIQRLTRSGHESEARALLDNLAEQVAAHRPILRGVMGAVINGTAQAKAAEALDATQRHILAPFFAGQPAENLHAANDEHPASPEQPGPSVA